MAAPSPKSLLFLSNGHGEDLNASAIARALGDRYPQIDLAAMPLVGEGNAYRRAGVPIIGPTQTLPSGGMIYTHLWNLIRDLGSGLIGLTVRQFRAVRAYSRRCDGAIVVGDILPLTFALLAGRPYCAFIVSTSSYYEGRLRLPWLSRVCLRSPRCLAVFTRDRFTAEDLQRQGLAKAEFAGYPIADLLQPSDSDLHLLSDLPTIALLPGSRLPEALSNLALQLKVCEAIAAIAPVQFRAALVPQITETHLAELADREGWTYAGAGRLTKLNGDRLLEIGCYWQRFADIVYRCDLAIGMAGTAVEQAVGLGKPVVQIPGFGPQFTYAFAEAQMRLLGCSVVTVGKKPSDPNLFTEAAQKVLSILEDRDYRDRCRHNGLERVGLPGGSRAIADRLAQLFTELSSHP